MLFLYFDLINKLNIYWIIFVWGSSLVVWLAIMQPCPQKSFALQAILLFIWTFWDILLFIYILFLYFKKKKRKIPKIRPIYIIHLFICLFLCSVCILDLIYIYFIIESLSYIYWVLILANKNVRIWDILGKK